MSVSQELNETEPDALVPVNVELVKDLWLPNIFIYNLKTFKVVEVLSKHAGLWVSPENAILYSQATHITFICPMRFDSFPLDTQVSAFAEMQWQGQPQNLIQNRSLSCCYKLFITLYYLTF